MKKNILFLAAVLICFSLLLFGFIPTGDDTAAPRTVSAVALEPQSVSDTVDVSGVVGSQTITKIYSTLSYPALNVAVKTGDRVSEGDLLCQLDTESLELSIKQQTTAISNAQSKAGQNLVIAQNNLDTVVFNNEKNYNTAVVNAQNAVNTAEAALEAAQNAYTSANRVLRTYREQSGYTSGNNDTQEAQFAASRNNASASIETAEQNVVNARAALRAAEIAAKEQEITYKQQVQTAKLATNFSDQQLAVEQLKLNLEKAVITAPVSGVVTAVNVVEGAPGSGLLFVIEDTGNLEVTANVSENDIISVKTGMTATLWPEADDTDLYGATIAEIALSPAKTPTGDNVNAPVTSYETKANVTSGAGNLRIGMHVRLRVETVKKDNVFAVPYSCVTKNRAGESMVLVAKPDGLGSYTIEEVAVTRGIETELHVEISSDKLAAGDIILTSVLGVHGGDIINVQV